MPQINSLPDLRAAGIVSPEYEEARKVHQRILGKQREIENDLETLIAKLNRAEGADMRDLAERWLSGEDDVPEDEALAELRAERDALIRRQRTLRDVALPEAEARVLNVIQRHRQEWARQIAQELPERIRELQEVLPEVQQTIAPKLYRVQSAAQILEWCEGPNPSVYSPPQDSITPLVARPIQEYTGTLSRRLAERAQVRHFEELDKEVTA